MRFQKLKAIENLSFLVNFSKNKNKKNEKKNNDLSTSPETRVVGNALFLLSLFLGLPGCPPWHRAGLDPAAPKAQPDLAAPADVEIFDVVGISEGIQWNFI